MLLLSKVLTINIVAHHIFRRNSEFKPFRNKCLTGGSLYYYHR